MIHRLTCGREDVGLRLDQFLHIHIPEMSRGQIRKVIDLGGVHTGGRRVRKAGGAVSSDQQIEMHLDERPLTPYRIAPSDVLFQDKHMIVLNKSAGVETQPTMARYKGTLYEALQIWLDRDRRQGRKLEIGMAQRLDRDTTGVIVFSIHPYSHKGFSHQIQNRLLEKTYLALVAGHPEPAQGEYRSLLAKERRTNRIKSVPKGGKEAITKYRVVQSSGEISLMEIGLVTGRTHQIRVHFSEAGHPLLGDKQYDGPEQLGGQTFPRQCLHSWKLRLAHPVSGDLMELTAPVPEDMNRLIQ